MYTCTCVSLVRLDRWHRWQAATGHDVITHSRMVGPLASLAGCQRSWRHNSRMVGPLASLAAWPPEVMTSHALAWLVRWHRWSVGIVGRLPEAMTRSRTALAWLVRWHRWSVGRLPEVMTSQLSHGTWSVGIVGRLPEVMTSHVHSPWLVRWHRWSVGRLPEVMTSHTLASGIGTWVRWHRCSVGIVGRLPDRS